MQGKVKWFNATKGFGFISPVDGSKDVFVHHSAVKRANISELRENATVTFDIEKTAKGDNAVNLKLV